MYVIYSCYLPGIYVIQYTLNLHYIDVKSTLYLCSIFIISRLKLREFYIISILLYLRYFYIISTLIIHVIYINICIHYMYDTHVFLFVNTVVIKLLVVVVL